jgi:tubulin--tyrosine ligase
MHNHLENNFHLSNKKALFYNIKNYMNLLNKDPFQIIPLTFHINCKKELNEDL